MRELVVMLPCYNEEAALPGLLDRLEAVSRRLEPEWRLTIMVIDDGSTDRTGEIAKSRRDVLYVSHPQNLGLGAAMDTAFVNASRLPDLAPDHHSEIIAVMDADGTHPPELLPEMLRRLDEANLGVVIASRFAPGGGEHGLPPLRRLYTRLAAFAMHVLAPIPGVKDYSCGYRLYRSRAIAAAQGKYTNLITEQGFVCMVELLVKLARSGAKCGEVGLDLHYELKQGPSKMKVGATIRRYARFAWRARFDPLLR